MQYEGGSSRSTVSRIRAWSVVVVFLVLVTVALLDRQAITLMVDPIKESYGISDAQMSLLQGAAFAIPFLIGTIPMGSVIDRFSPRWTICLAVLLWSAATIACALAESFLELLIARGLIGLGQAVLQPASWSIVARLFPAHRLSLAISVLSMGTQVGAAISFLLEYVSIALALVRGIGFSMGTEPCTIITCFVLTSFLQPFSGVAAAALQIATPAELRGRASALFSMFYNAFGMIVGPSVVALLADNLEVGRSLGIAIALNFAIFGGASAFCFWRGREYATRSIALLRSVEPA
jgi:MFS family permease